MTVPPEPSLAAAAAEFLRCAPPDGAWDEVFASGGEIRPHWQGLLQSIGTLGPARFAERADDGRRILSEHGVSVPAPGAPEGTEHPWPLDFLPMVIGAGEWRALEAGLRQRAHLLNSILQDLHGKQRLIRNGFVPAPLIFANPGYLRACQAIDVPGGVYLHLYAADLARSPDGRWWVLADRTQAPAGFGFAQEGRTIMSRVLPEAVRDLRPRSLAGTWRLRRESMRRLASRTSDRPAIVLLTPGPRNEAWFEHAYLTRLLGFTLVEADDLTVRDRRVFIKTLDGLRPVDVVLRRVSDLYCDPLELRSDSLLGVPGLVEAVRAGQVAIANALGTGLLEGPAFLSFMPNLCRQILGEELRLPSIATWWCGQARELNYAREHAAELVFRSSFNLAGDVGTMERDRCLETIRQRPYEFVGQEQVQLSRLPVSLGGRWESRPFVLRLFVVREGDSYTVMPGGIARVVESDRVASFALSLGGLSKDVWVLPDESADGETQQVVVPTPLPRERAPSDLPSRTADNFFWLGRYTERLEQLARLARCVVGRLSDEAGLGGDRQVAALGRLLTRLGVLPPPLAASPPRAWLQKELLLTVHQDGRSPGVRELLKHIHLAAFAVRYRLSADTWRILNRLGPDARQRSARLPLLMSAAVLNTLILDLAAFGGMETENMTRGHGWVFLELGRRLERGISMARLLGGALQGGDDVPLLLEPALEVADSVITHRWRYFDQPRPEGVLELLLHDPTNPRSLAFQVDRTEELAARLPTGINPEGAARVRRCIADLGTLTREAPTGPDQAATLARLSTAFLELSELLSHVYFSQIPLRMN